jgi:hypothetical protein
MSDRNNSRRKAARAFTWTCLVLVPALAIIGLGTGLSWTSDGSATSQGLQTAETRLFSVQGDLVTAKPAEQGSIGDFADTWQNTVRIPPSPRR